MKHEKTFEAINKLKDVEIELHRLKNLLEITGRALDAKSEWVGLTDEDMEFLFPHGKSAWLTEILKVFEAKLKQKNNIRVND